MDSFLPLALTVAVLISKSTGNVICGVGVDYQDGDIVLDDIVSTSITILDTTYKNLNSLTRQGKHGPFYTIGHQNTQSDSEFTLFKYNPCTNTTLETIGTGLVNGYDVQGLAYNPNDNLLYAMFIETILKSTYKLYTINPNTASVTYITDVSVLTPTLEFDENGILYGWSDTQGLFTIDISTGNTNIISSTSHIGTEPFQFLAFDPNDDNIIYGGFRNVYKIDKLHGNYTVTSYEAHSHRGFIILDQDTCTQIECTTTTNQPITTTAVNTSLVQSTGTDAPIITGYMSDINSTQSNTNSPTLQATILPTTLPTIQSIFIEQSDASIDEQSESDSISTTTIIIGAIIFFGFFCIVWYCRVYHQKKIKKGISTHPSTKNAMETQIDINGTPLHTRSHMVNGIKSSDTPSDTPEPVSLEIEQDGEHGNNVIGVINTVPLGMTPATYATNAMGTTYGTDNMMSTYNSTLPDMNRMSTVNTDRNGLIMNGNVTRGVVNYYD